MDLMGSEYLIGKMISMFKDQETLLSYIRARIRINFKGEMGVREIVGMETPKTKLQNHIKQLDDNEVRIELLELNQKYEDLEHTYNIAKEVSESMTDDWRNSELRAREFEKLYEQEKMMHQIHVKDLMDQFEEKESKWKEEKEKQNNHFDNFKEDMKKELEIKEKIINRYIKYLNVMNKEMVIAKNVVKNPDLMRKTLRTLNFSQLDIYKYKKPDAPSKKVNKSVSQPKNPDIPPMEQETLKPILNITEKDKKFNTAERFFTQSITTRPITTSEDLKKTNPQKMSFRKRLRSVIQQRPDRTIPKENSLDRSSLKSPLNITTRRKVFGFGGKRKSVCTPKNGEYTFNSSIGFG